MPRPDTQAKDNFSWMLITVIAMVATAATGVLSLLQASLAAAAIIFISGCTSEGTARRAIDWAIEQAGGSVEL